MLYFIGLPFGFILNGYFLRFINIKTLYFTGALLQGIIALSVVFVDNPSTTILGFFGLLFGLGSGLFWGNSNYLQQVLTNSSNRLYYMSLESITYILMNILSPLIAGLLISFGTTSGIYSIQEGYQIVMVVAMVLLSISGINIFKVQVDDLNHPELFIQKKHKYWNLNRLYVFITDIFLGVIMILPSILILGYVGNEGYLGSIQAFGSFLAAAIIYLIGRRATKKHYFRLILIAWILFLLASIPLMLELNSATITLFLIIIIVANELRYIVSWPLSMDLIDDLSENKQTLKYAFINDNEIFFNLGRIVGLNLIVLLWFIASEEFSLRVAAFLVLLVQPIGLFAARKILSRVEE